MTALINQATICASEMTFFLSCNNQFKHTCFKSLSNICVLCPFVFDYDSAMGKPEFIVWTLKPDTTLFLYIKGLTE